MKTKFFLVTGGAGFIGSHWVRRLVSEGHRVRVLDNGSRGSAARLSDVKDQIDYVEADIREAKAVFAASEGVDSVCHLAFVNGTEFFYSKPETVLDVGVKGMVNVLDACVSLKIRELFLASSSEVYQTPDRVPTDETVSLTVPDPSNPRYSYGAAKILSEVMALNFGKKFFDRVVIFRPHNVYGPAMGWEHVIPQFIDRMSALANIHPKTVPFPIQGTGDATRSFVYIDDFIEALTILLDRGTHNQIYHIGTTEEVLIRDLALRVAKIYGREAILQPGPAPAGGVSRRCPDIRKMEALGYRPKISLEDGLRRTVQWCNQHPRHIASKRSHA